LQAASRLAGPRGRRTAGAQRSVRTRATVRDAEKGTGQCVWRRAFVDVNEPGSADGSVRVLLVSVDDEWEALDMRRDAFKRESSRWADGFEIPGQFVGIAVKEETPGGDDSCPADVVLPVASSPTTVREASSQLSVAKLELVVSEDGPGAELCKLGRGERLLVTQPLGEGFAPLQTLTENAGLLNALEEGRDLIIIGCGYVGYGALRSAAGWAPVQAAAAAGPRRVQAVQFFPSKDKGACVPEWSAWRDDGMGVHVFFGEEEEAKIVEALERTVLANPEPDQPLPSLEGCTVLLAGLPKPTAAVVLRKLVERGVPREHVLVPN